MSNLPIQLIITSTNRDYCMVCISVYGSRASFFDISCTQTLFCPEISLVRLESPSLILPLLIPHTKGSIEYNTVLIHRKVCAVGTFLLCFCITLCKDTSKYQYYFFVKGDTPPIRILVTS